MKGPSPVILSATPLMSREFSIMLTALHGPIIQKRWHADARRAWLIGGVDPNKDPHAKD